MLGVALAATLALRWRVQQFTEKPALRHAAMVAAETARWQCWCTVKLVKHTANCLGFPPNHSPPLFVPAHGFQDRFMATQIQRQTGRLAALESIRGMSALAVVFFHLAAIHVRLPDGLLSRLVGTLGQAVPVFFALSAFALLYGYADRLFAGGGSAGLKHFYIRRVFRIMPLYLAVLSLFVIKSAMEDSFLSTSKLLLNVLFLFPLIPGAHEGIVWASWSLGVEWLFYIAFPLTLLLAGNARGCLVLLLLAMLVRVALLRFTDGAVPAADAMLSVVANLCFFAAGMTAFAVARDARCQRVVSFVDRYGWALFAGSAMLIVAWVATAAADSLTKLPGLGGALFSAVLVLWLLWGYTGLPAALDNAVTRFLGRISYSLYLMHSLVLWGLSALGVFAWITAQVGAAYAGYWACAAVSVLAVLPVSYLMYRAAEKPGIALGERVLGSTRTAPVGGQPARQS